MTATDTAVHRDFRVDVRAERKRLSAYAAESRAAEAELTAQYGGDWLKKLSEQVPPTAQGQPAPSIKQVLSEDEYAAVLDEAKARFAQIEADDDTLNRAYDAFKGTMRTGLSAWDSVTDTFRNRALRQLMETSAFVHNPSVQGGKALLDQTRWADAAYNTTLWTQIDAARQGGFSAGFVEGTGNGFFINPESPVMQEKNKRAYEFAALKNGDAASFGRLAAESVGFSKGSDPYNWLSGAVDTASVLVFDPSTYITGGAGQAGKEAAQAAKILKGIGLEPDEVVRVSRAIEHLGPLAKDDDITTQVGKVFQARTKLRLADDNPDLIKSKRAAWQDEELRKAAQNTARLNEFSVDSRVDLEAFRGLGDEVDAAVKRVNAAMDDQVRRDLAAGRGDTRFDPDTELTFDTVDAAAQEARATDEYFRLESQLMQTLKGKGVDLKDIDPEDWVAMLKAYAGFSSKGVDVRQAVRAFTGGDFDDVARLIARTDSPADLYDLFPHVGTDTLRAWARTTDEHEALTVLMNGALTGDVTRAGSRVARWAVMHGQSGAKGASFARRVTRFSRDATPNSGMVSFENADEMLKLTSDFITEGASMAYRRTSKLDGWEAFRKRALEDAINATDPVARKRAWIQMQQDFLEQIPSWNKLTTQAKKELRDKFARAWDQDETQKVRTAAIRANMKDRGIESRLIGMADNPLEFDEQYKGLISSLVDLSDNVAMNDPKYMRKLFDIVDEAGKFSAKGKVVEATTMVNDAFDAYLRPLMLAFRPGYATLQIIDSGMRALLIGSTNLLSSPVQTLAGVAAHLTLTKDSSLLHALQKIVKTAPTNPDGTPMFGRAQVSGIDDLIDGAADRVTATYLQRVNFRDVLTGDDAHSRDMIDLGWTIKQPGDDLYIEGWAQDALLHLTPGKYGDDMFRDVFDLRLDGVAPERIRKWAQTAEVNAALSNEELITEYYFRGPGKALFHKLAASAQTKQTKIPLMQQIVSDKTKLHSYLWDQDEAMSIVNLVDELTARSNPAVMRTLRDASDAKGSWLKYLNTMPQRKADKALRGKGKPFVRDITMPDGSTITVNVAKRGALDQVVRRALSGVDDESRPLTVRYRAKASHGKGTGAREGYQNFLSHFFSPVSFLEKRVGQAPVLRDDILLESAKRAVFLSQKDAKTLEQRILSQIPKVKRTAKQRQTVAILKANVREASGSGAYTLEDVTDAAHNAAFRRLSDTMYGIRGRNAAAQRLSIFLPFIQSWVNAFRVYLKESVRHPNRAVNALRMLDWANTSESGVLYDTLPGVDRDDDPGKPLFWTDSFGNRQVSIPYLGYAANVVDSAFSKLMGTEDNPNFQPYLNLRVDRWNPANFGEPLPGVGYGVTIPAALIESRTGIVQDDLHKWWFAMQSTDASQQESGLQAALPWFIKMAWPTDSQIEAQVGNAMVALAANEPDKYMQDGYIRADKVGELHMRAQSLASGIARGNIWRAAMFRGGTTIPRSVAVNGENLSAAVLSKEFGDVLDETGSIQAGYAFLLDKYGPQGVAALVGTREKSVSANDEGYKFAQDNPELFAQITDVLGYFMPASDINCDPDYALRSRGFQRMLTQRGVGLMLSPTEWAQEVNRALKGARDYQLEQKFARGEITQSQFETEKALIAKDYQLVPSPEFDTSHGDKIREQLRIALQNPTLANTAAGKALAAYLPLYDQAKAQADGESLDGEADAPLRATLRAQGEQLAELVPEFRPLWRGQLLWEVDE